MNDGAKVYRVFQTAKSVNYQRYTHSCAIQNFYYRQFHMLQIRHLKIHLPATLHIHTFLCKTMHFSALQAPHYAPALRLKHLTKHVKRLQLRHSFKVKAVIRIDVAQEARTFGTVEVENVHRFVAHAQQHGDKLSFRVGKVI